MRGVSFEDVLPRVAEIVTDVRERGDAALLDWTERLDGERPELRVRADQLRAIRRPRKGRGRLTAFGRGLVVRPHATVVPGARLVVTQPEPARSDGRARQQHGEQAQKRCGSSLIHG